jgi:hypothetical protein
MRVNTVLAVGGTAVLALAVACGPSATPTSPAPAASQGTDLGPGGATLKIAAPATLSPINGVEISIQNGLVLVVGNVSGTYASFPVTYEVEVRSPSGALVLNPKFSAAGGATTSYAVTTQLAFDTVFTWRVRATYNGGFGPWSGYASFKTPLAGYIASQEIFDPMTTGSTVGVRNGNVTCTTSGCRLGDNLSFIRYDLPSTLEAGEFSLMEMGADEGNPGAKTKVMSMAEGGSDITDNDYRMTVELRGRDAGDAGAVSCRIITGDASDEGRIFDCSPRVIINPSSSRWYFWRFTWRTGNATLEVREDSPTGNQIYFKSLGTGSHPYRPSPQVIYIGAPEGRNGPADASAAPMLVKDIWVSANPRPDFPSLLARRLLPRPGGR